MDFLAKFCVPTPMLGRGRISLLGCRVFKLCCMDFLAKSGVPILIPLGGIVRCFMQMATRFADILELDHSQSDG